MSEDMNMGSMVIDQALDTTSTDSTVEAPSTETTTTNDETTVDNTPVEGAEETTEEEISPTKEDGTAKTAEEIEQEKTERTATAQGKGKESASILEQRAALKALRDLDPKYAKVVKELHGSAERWNAAKELLGAGEGGGVIGLKSLLDAAGVKSLPELSRAYVEQVQNWEAVKQTDQMLYSANKELAKNVWEDLKHNVGDKAPEVFGKNVANLVEALRTNPETKAAYYNEVSKPNLHASLMESKFPVVLNALHEALQAGDGKMAGAVLSNIVRWWNSLDLELSETGKINAEKERWTSERAEAESKTKAAEIEKWENSTAETADKTNNTLLSKSLAPFLKLPFFKGYGKENLMPLGNLVKANLYAALKADSVYQNQISALWKAGNNPENNRRIQEYHESAVKSIADRVVRESVHKLYPGYAKGGTAAGRVAAATDKKAAAAKAGAQSLEKMVPIYVASRPENLVRDQVKVGGKEYNAEALRTLQVLGRGFTKGVDGKLRLVTWRKS